VPVRAVAVVGPTAKGGAWTTKGADVKERAAASVATKA
jgi:hypothetical protein